MPYVITYWHQKQFYFDQYEFNDNPIKYYLHMRLIELNTGRGLYKWYYATKNEVILRDSPFTRSLNFKNITYYTFD